ncbi:ankyrin repeat and SOCS box protein 10-like [Rhinoderma darwinii]|uniref:ankyrin repeat and SOCS box protein 10-like n=1 Tax=Rhinoderma darwinii TaxID=43563 RepID=UPI003F67CA0F
MSGSICLCLTLCLIASQVLRYCCSSPRTVEVLLNTYSKLRGTEDWAEVVPEEEQQVLRYCCSSPRTVEVLLNTYSKLRGTEDWAEVVPEEEQQKNRLFFQSVFWLSRSPRSLQHLCRCALRSHLEGRLPRTLPRLPLPPPLLHFLQLGFEDVLY